MATASPILLSTTQQVLGRHLESKNAKQLHGLESWALAKTYVLNCGSLSLRVDRDQCWRFGCHLGGLSLECHQTLGMNKPFGPGKELARTNKGCRNK